MVLPRTEKIFFKLLSLCISAFKQQRSSGIKCTKLVDWPRDPLVNFRKVKGGKCEVKGRGVKEKPEKER